MSESPNPATVTMAELLVQFPGARRALFAEYHIGGCQSCAFQPEETLGELCARNEDLDPQLVFAHIEKSHDSDARILITPAELKQRLEGDAPPLLLDVRTREEHESIKIPGSFLLTQEKIAEVLGGTPGEGGPSAVIIDHHGDRCLDAAAYLIGHGLDDVRCLEGGIDAYSQQVDGSIPRYRVEMED